MPVKPEKQKIKIKRSSFWLTAILLVPFFFLIGLWISDVVFQIGGLQHIIYQSTGSGYSENLTVYGYLIRYGIAAAGAVIGLILTAPAYLMMSAIASKVEHSLTKYSSKEIMMGIIGLVLGVLLAVLISFLINIKAEAEWVRVTFSVILGILLGYVGMRIGAKLLYDILPATNVPRPAKMSSAGNLTCYVLDSSALIDGRVLDIVRTGFLTGLFLIPADVLNELNRIADSADDLKKNRGRRGLDIVTALQKEKNITVSVIQPTAEVKTVDDAVIAIANEHKARLITSDSNLVKFASAQKIENLNINELSNAIRPILLPGEKLTLKIVKRGKEAGQGLGYAPDGTLIVIENGENHVGETVEVTVMTSLQSSGGRMIFTRILDGTQE